MKTKSNRDRRAWCFLASATILLHVANAAYGTCTVAIEDKSPILGDTKNVGQEVILFAQIVWTGTLSQVSWKIPGTTIRSYDESVASGWSITGEDTDRIINGEFVIRFFWKETAASRKVEIDVTTTGGSCHDEHTFAVERNMANPDRQAEDFYTSCCHLPLGSTNRVLIEHAKWHSDHPCFPEVTTPCKAGYDGKDFLVCGGVLQSAPTVAGPWTDIFGSTSPTMIDKPMKFFRVLLVP